MLAVLLQRLLCGNHGGGTDPERRLSTVRRGHLPADEHDLSQLRSVRRRHRLGRQRCDGLRVLQRGQPLHRRWNDVRVVVRGRLLCQRVRVCAVPGRERVRRGLLGARPLRSGDFRARAVCVLHAVP